MQARNKLRFQGWYLQKMIRYIHWLVVRINQVCYRYWKKTEVD